MKNYIQESIDLKQQILQDEELLEKVNLTIQKIGESLKAGNKILAAGNGGSAADAQHFVAEIVGRYKKERKGYGAIALTTDPSVVTAWSNDYSFDSLFARQVESLGKAGDIFFGISTSGNSKNVIEAAKKAKEQGLTVICLLGEGGELKNLADIAINIRHTNTPRIQECHIMLIHIICEEVENSYLVD